MLATVRTVLAALVAALLLAGTALAGPVVPNDPYYPNAWYADDLGLPAAWAVSMGSEAVTLAVLDTGVVAGTPDLEGRVLAPLSATGGAPLDGTANHHGTWVASAAAMGIDNGIGGVGVGEFSILPVTVTDTMGLTTPETIAAGITAAADAGARVINVSVFALNYAPIEAAAAYARSKGALVFVAAGNQNAYVNYTGLDHLVFVSGIGTDGGRWDAGTSGSNWGPYIDLAAPAEDVLVADALAGYGTIDGTSFAAPLAAGAAALAWSINPNLTPDQVLAILYGTATDLGDPGWDEVYGHGLIDVGGVAAGAQSSLAPEPATVTLVAAGIAAVLGVRRRRGKAA